MNPHSLGVLLARSKQISPGGRPSADPTHPPLFGAAAAHVLEPGVINRGVQRGGYTACASNNLRYPAG